MQKNIKGQDHWNLNLGGIGWWKKILCNPAANLQVYSPLTFFKIRSTF
jgi:hypothetical protein